MRQLIVATVLIGLLTGFAAALPSTAEAVCTQTIYAERSEVNGVTTQVMGRLLSNSVILWFANTTDPEFARTIVAAVAQRNRLTVIGDAASCPTTGTFRFQGNIRGLIQQP